jgi:hypothetical protein
MTQRTNGDVNILKEERMRQLLLQESKDPFAWWYLSYADEEHFRGGVIIEARGFASAVVMAGQLGYSPGGQVTGLKIPASELPPPQYRSRCLTKEELNEFWEMENLGELDGQKGPATS